MNDRWIGEDLPFSEADGLCTLAVDVQRLGFTRKLEDDAIESVTRVGSGDGDTFGEGECT